MEFQIPNFLPALPEIVVAVFALLGLLFVALQRKSEGSAFWMAQLALWSGAFFSLCLGRSPADLFEALRSAGSGFEVLRNLGEILVVWVGSSESTWTFSQLYQTDALGELLKAAACMAVALGLIYGRRYMRERKLDSGEYYLLVLFATLGVMVLASAGSLLTIYIGLELLSLSSYALVAINRNELRSTEAAMKYFVLGALASGLLLYGMSMIYGATQTLVLLDLIHAMDQAAGVNQTVLLFGLVFVVAGVAFKLGVAPFHMWVPDVYEGAPSSITLFLASASKIAAFVMACRLLAQGLWGLIEHWKLMLLLAGIASIMLGNLAGIAQTNFKRMLAYSGISHMGFLLLGFASSLPELTRNAYSASLFYMLTYVLTTLAAFGILLLMTREGYEAEQLDDFRGLNQRSPWWAAMMAIAMFSMAGIPFFVGFFAKFFVLQAVWQAGYTYVAVLAVLMSLIGAFFYLRVVKLMYFDAPAADAPAVNAGCRLSGGLLSANALALGLLGLFPGVLLQLCVVVVQASLAP
ncbi:MAG: NADH-quinone oxidoreductase subunit N [Candidatus Dactylopiibacterium carminicum]|uniref:NADH-quinone oxidoreductase subunit N n=1 Tax=Candidatus Dactylopiibacterium carminicum TaxID=857335 RepID=A0A272ER53_9RHOO|nr:NADH-quinone oxidoreductase subunit NuoN [Candidatus Dactylopiibacterium carminicum]PAS92190.1 MAG: NADH-quinone oxidoreductase subunit N [Candidatus Dactylopiibacterium carminicum]PAS95660.1 MAG: NADH-quinone oxidoreductase subunit N [Candidatus Dactylopiibacterium carminicum]PAS97651.1 MAG: NADH:ubiquinone oxidoreductase subunit N [Candidatus Dactylopiibacterium carminicum]